MVWVSMHASYSEGKYACASFLFLDQGKEKKRTHEFVKKNVYQKPFVIFLICVCSKNLKTANFKLLKLAVS